MSESDMLTTLRGLRIACVIPTLNRRELLISFIKNYVVKCTIPTDLVVVDNSPDEFHLIEPECFELVQGTPHTLKSLAPHIGRGVGKSRAYGVDYVLKNTAHEFIINADDDAIIGNECIERLVAAAYQEPKFGYVGSAGNYLSFWRDFDSRSVKFYMNLGIVWCLSRSMLNVCGNFDTELSLREDVEMGLRSWANGFYTVAVWAPVVHKRSNPDFASGNDKWLESNSYIKAKYGDMITTTSNGQIRQNKKVFRYPDITYTVDDDLVLSKSAS